jgi:hypothetical protein
LNPVDVVHAFDDAREYRKVVVQAEVVHEIDEDLAIAGVATSGRDAEGAALV